MKKMMYCMFALVASMVLAAGYAGAWSASGRPISP
jgi:hypothetical protein